MPAPLNALLAWRVAGATGAATLGALLSLLFDRSARAVGALASFAAGGLLGVTLFHLLPESVVRAGGVGAALAAIAGFGLFALPGEALGVACPACGDPAAGSDSVTGRRALAGPPHAQRSPSRAARLGLMVVLALTLHSVADGLAITAGTEADSMAGGRLGLLLTIAVSYHKVPEGMALMSLARMSGLRAGKALFITVAVELATALGALAGLLFQGLSTRGMGLLLGAVAGSFLYVIVFAILREAWRHDRWRVVPFAALGLMSIWLLGKWLVVNN